MKKQCPQCGITKVSTSFYANKNIKDGLHTTCKECCAVNSKIRRELPGNRERDNEAQKRWRANPKNKRSIISSSYISKYGITLTCYEEMLKEQDSRCYICGIEDQYNGKPLYVDHCHSKQQVRKLLCQHCNSGLGMFKDNPKLLIKAADYLKEHNDRT